MEYKKEGIYSIIKDSLEKNPDVKIMAIIGNELDAKGYTTSVQFVHDLGKYSVGFCVAPKNGLFQIHELQKFMMDLIPKDLEPENIIPFRGHNVGSGMDLGELRFRDVIGEVTTVMQFRSPYRRVNVLEGLVDGKKTVTQTKEMVSMISIAPFPSQRYAKDYLAGLVDENSIRHESLMRYKNMG